MISKGMKVLICIAIALQFVALFISIVIVCNPQPAYQLFGASEEIWGSRVVPFVTLASLVIPFLWLGVVAAFVLFTQKVSVLGKTIIIVAVVLYCVSNFVLNFAFAWENILAGRQGTDQLMALSTIRSAISWVTGPLTTAAFVLFTMVAGGYLWQKHDRV